MSKPKIILRTNREGVTRATFRCSVIGAGAFALRDAAAHLITSGKVRTSDTLQVYRGRVFQQSVIAAQAARLTSAGAV